VSARTDDKGLASDVREQQNHRSSEVRGTAGSPGVRGIVVGLQFSDDSTTLSARSLDRTVSIYDVPTYTRLGDPIPVAVSTSRGQSLRPDGSAVAISTGDGIAIWDLDPDHLATAACRLAGRNLTPTEWDTHLGGLGTYRPTCPEPD
jgi:WD40 repeat protein